VADRQSARRNIAELLAAVAKRLAGGRGQTSVRLAHGRARRAGAHGSVECVSLEADPLFGIVVGLECPFEHLPLRPGDRLMLPRSL